MTQQNPADDMADAVPRAPICSVPGPRAVVAAIAGMVCGALLPPLACVTLGIGLVLLLVPPVLLALRTRHPSFWGFALFGELVTLAPVISAW